MVKTEGRGRIHDAEETRQTILDAAEAIFARYGFAGARIDAIAKAANYNKSLLFQYFGDKLGLYTAVIKRADEQLSDIEACILTPLRRDDGTTFHARQFRAFLATMARVVFDYLLDHPQLVRILLWEQAAGWQTYLQIASQMQAEDVEQFEAFFQKARSSGMLRSDFTPIIQMTMSLQMCLSYLAFLPLYQLLLGRDDVSSAQELSRARESIVAWVVAGMLVDAPETALEKGD